MEISFNIGSVFTYLLNHIELVIMLVMFILAKLGWTSWVVETRKQAEALYARKEVQFAAELAYSLVERYRRKNPTDPKDPKVLAWDFFREFFTKLGKEPPPDASKLVEGVWDVLHERDVQNGLKPGSPPTTATTVEQPDV